MRLSSRLRGRSGQSGFQALPVDKRISELDSIGRQKKKQAKNKSCLLLDKLICKSRRHDIGYDDYENGLLHNSHLLGEDNPKETEEERFQLFGSVGLVHHGNDTAVDAGRDKEDTDEDRKDKDEDKGLYSRMEADDPSVVLADDPSITDVLEALGHLEELEEARTSSERQDLVLSSMHITDNDSNKLMEWGSSDHSSATPSNAKATAQGEDTSSSSTESASSYISLSSTSANNEQQQQQQKQQQRSYPLRVVEKEHQHQHQQQQPYDDDGVRDVLQLPSPALVVQPRGSFGDLHCFREAAKAHSQQALSDGHCETNIGILPIRAVSSTHHKNDTTDTRYDTTDSTLLFLETAAEASRQEGTIAAVTNDKAGVVNANGGGDKELPFIPPSPTGADCSRVGVNDNDWNCMAIPTQLIGGDDDGRDGHDGRQFTGLAADTAAEVARRKRSVIWNVAPSKVALNHQYEHQDEHQDEIEWPSPLTRWQFDDSFDCEAGSKNDSPAIPSTLKATDTLLHLSSIQDNDFGRDSGFVADVGTLQASSPVPVGKCSDKGDANGDRGKGDEQMTSPHVFAAAMEGANSNPTRHAKEVVDLVEWPSCESPEYRGSPYEYNENPDEQKIKAGVEVEKKEDEEYKATMTFGQPQHRFKEKLSSSKEQQLEEKKQQETSTEAAGVPEVLKPKSKPEPQRDDHPRSLQPKHTERTLRKFLLFDEQDAILHRPTAMRRNTCHDPAILSVPVVQKILNGPQGPSSLTPQGLLLGAVQETKTKSSVRNNSYAAQQQVGHRDVRSDKVPYEPQQSLHRSTRRQEKSTEMRSISHRRNVESPTGSSHTNISTASSRVQLYWNSKQIANRPLDSKEFDVDDDHEDGNVNRLESIPTPLPPRVKTTRRSPEHITKTPNGLGTPPRSQTFVSSRIRALQQQLASDMAAEI